MNCSYILGINPLSVMTYKCLLPFNKQPFCFVDSFSCSVQAFWFDVVPHVHVCLCLFCLGWQIQKKIAKTGVREHTAFVLFWEVFFFKLIYFNWRLITLQYYRFCHISTWISHGCTCVPHPEPPSTSLPTSSPWVVPVHQLWVPCFMHWTCTDHLFHIR